MRARRYIPFAAVLVAVTASAATPVLRVNDAELTDTDLKLAQQVVTLQMRREKPGATASGDSVMGRTVEKLISQTLLLQAAHESQIVVTPAEVAAEIDQQRTRQGAAAFDAYLAGLGLTAQEYSRRVGDQMAVRKFVGATVASKIAVSETDAKAFYDANPAVFQHPEEVRLRTILVKVDPGAEGKAVAAARERAEAVRKRLTQGQDMAAVATGASDDPSRAYGGDIGWVREDMLLPDFKSAVWALKPGELSEVLKSPLGYHIFKAEERRGPGTTPFEEVKARLTDVIRNERLVAAIEAVVKERMAKAKIEALDPAVKAALEAPKAQPSASPPH